jgi:hypothetical protein
MFINTCLLSIPEPIRSEHFPTAVPCFADALFLPRNRPTLALGRTTSPCRLLRRALELLLNIDLRFIIKRDSIYIYMFIRTTLVQRSFIAATTVRKVSVSTSSRTPPFKLQKVPPQQKTCPAIRKMSTQAAPLTAWKRLIRYVSATDGATRYGEPIVDGKNPDIDGLALSGDLKVQVLEGPSLWEAKPTGKEDSVKTLLGPLTPEDVPAVRCVGLNYKTHSKFRHIISIGHCTHLPSPQFLKLALTSQ